MLSARYPPLPTSTVPSLTKTRRDPVNVLGSYIVQLCEQVLGMWDLVTSLYADIEARQLSGAVQPTLEELQKVPGLRMYKS